MTNKLPYETETDAIIANQKFESTRDPNKEYIELTSDELQRLALITTNQLKWSVIQQAQAVILGLAAFLAMSTFLILMLGADTIAPSAQAVVFGAPIVAIATITIFSILGVFNGKGGKGPTEEVQNTLKTAGHLTDLSG